ncbi:hypothetical protein GCM10022421_15050 [Oceanisphaera sediminis]|uniref:Uncharacterized protein n=1 Tax=Oceanisphaera sediminis TaxID=981381 RepID=A0ABP7DSK1_9GAMM
MTEERDKFVLAGNVAELQALFDTHTTRIITDFYVTHGQSEYLADGCRITDRLRDIATT